MLSSVVLERKRRQTKSSQYTPMHEQAAVNDAILPYLVNGTSSCSFITKAAIKTNGASQLQQSAIDRIRCSCRRAGVTIGSLVLEESGMDTS